MPLVIFQNYLKFTYNNFEISLVVFMPKITTNDSIIFTYTIIISKTEVNFTLLLPYPFKRKFQVHVFMEFAVYLFR